MAVVAPAATVTLAGVVAAVLSSERETDEPPLGAGPLNVTVPVDDVPPLTDAGFILSEATAGGVIAKVADWLPFRVPVMVDVL